MTDTAQPGASFPRKIPTMLFFAGKYWNTYQHVVPAGISLEHAIDARYYQHVANQLKMFDVIELVAADNSFEARVRVTNANKGELSLRLVGYVGDPLTDEMPAEPAAPGDVYDVNFVPQHKWRVVEKATKEVVAKDYGTREEAQSAADNLLAARKAA